MNYWKGLLIAAAFDTAWIAGSRLLATEQAMPRYAPVTAPAEPDSLSLVQLAELDRRVDSLMVHLQTHPDDVGAMRDLARLYLDHGWHDDAIGPLARALQLDPARRAPWVALDRALERSGRSTITDADLVRAARAFVHAVEMWRHGC